ncbi:MAG: MBL fold metallo-hydrolase [Alphaproteobacteria bacterium]
MKITLLACASVIALSIPAYAGDHSGHDHGEARPYNYIPKEGYKSTTGSEYVTASSDKVLSVNQKVDDIFGAAVNGEVLVQRLSANSYWVFSGNYNTTFYVGGRGVLLLDPLGHDNATAVLEAIKSVTDKPVTAVVYSHNHSDHIGGISVFVEEAKKSGYELEIIATDKTVEKQKYLKSKLPAVTTVLPFKNGYVNFEGQTLRVLGFERAAHTDDSSMWILEEEGILHIPDHINPDQMPFLGFGGSENYVYFRSNLEEIANAEWKILSSGHGNVGSKKDVLFMLGYLDDIEAAVEKSSNMVDWNKLFALSPNNHEALMHSFAVEQARIATDLLRLKYGDYYGFEASVPYQVGMVANAMASYE